MKKPMLVLAFSLGLVAFLPGLVVLNRPQPPAVPDAPPTAMSGAAMSPEEARARANISAVPVVPNFFPATVYMHPEDGSGPGIYWGPGTYFWSAAGPLLITAYRTVNGVDPDRAFAFEVRVIGKKLPAPLYFEDVQPMAKPGAAGSRVLVASLSCKPKAFYPPDKSFSSVFGPSWGEARQYGKPIRDVQSIHSGRHYPIIGRANEDGGEPLFIVADYDTGAGEGGESFIDSDRRIWILIACPERGQWTQMQIDRRLHAGAPFRKGAALLSGPFLIKFPDD